MKVLDSSIWIEFYGDLPKAGLLEKYFSGNIPILVPAMILYEVGRFLLKHSTPQKTSFALSQMGRNPVISLNEEMALHAAKLSLQYKLGTADSIIYAIAQLNEAELVTLDNDFRKLPGCKVL